MGQNLSWFWFDFLAAGPCFRTRQRTPEVSPSPLNRQTRREETSRRPEQGTPNALSVRVKPFLAAFSSRMWEREQFGQSHARTSGGMPSMTV